MTLTTIEQIIFDWVDALLPDITIIDQHSDDATVDIGWKLRERWAQKVAQSIKTEQLPLLKQLNELLINKQITKRIILTHHPLGTWVIQIDVFKHRMYWPELTIELSSDDDTLIAIWQLIQYSKKVT